MVEFGSALVYLATFSHVVHDLLVEYVELPHFLVDLGEVLDVLTGVLDHSGGEGSLFPKLFVILHGAVDLVLFLVDFTDIVLKQVVQADVDVAVVVLLKEVGD